ncbi:SprT family zinc-dependent metalloprotease [Helicobacter sp. 11S02596-1]|uniref:M48 family metallopeptidase n=1 Tax=Helicobacter sp. 11S02596-1 TaxID=1476194 RepID=UPI000BA7043A|nr:SprT family zinc-dependent metalloprotease [Helicobacter sp. 11S02596-1]PAF41540.1 hypothetical protein BJI48_08450 [Helicobacter sp. 11S02596-1]
MDFIGTKTSNTNDCLVVKKTACKNPRIRIRQDGKNGKIDHKIILSVPFFYTQEQIFEVLASCDGWIKKSFEKIKRHHFEVQDFFSHHRDEILFFGKWVTHTPQMDLVYLKKELLNYIEARTKSLANDMGLIYRKISVRTSKTRLGSCSYQDNLNFSVLLIFAPQALIDYVIIHELAHIAHKNHSRDFWDLVGKFCPDYKEKRQELHKNVKFYIPMLEKILSLSAV